MSKTVVFYSRNCEYCVYFLQKLKEENLLSYFDNYHCIDTLGAPPTISMVPAILVNGATNPLEGEGIINWFNYMNKQKEQKEPEVQKEPENSVATLGDASSNVDFVELTGHGDNFDYADNNLQSGGGESEIEAMFAEGGITGLDAAQPVKNTDNGGNGCDAMTARMNALKTDRESLGAGVKRVG